MIFTYVYIREQIAESADEGKAERDVEKFDLSMGMIPKEDIEEDNKYALTNLARMGIGEVVRA